MNTAQILWSAVCMQALVLLTCGVLRTANAQTLRLAKVGEYTLDVSKNFHKTASFPRLFFQESSKKIYAVYAGIKTTSSGRSPQDQSVGWIEYDTTMTATGKAGVLGDPNYGGDIAVSSDGSNYYLLIAGPGGYLVYKYDANFSFSQKATVKLGPYDSSNDQLLNFTGNNLYFASISGDSAAKDPEAAVGQRWFVYSSALGQERDTVMKGESYIVTGGSIINNDGKLHVVTADKFLQGKLFAYQYTTDFKYIGKKLLAGDGQWSQGLTYDDGYYYVAYHTGLHGQGNVTLGIYDKNWSAAATQAVTSYSSMPGPSATGYNAQRPWVMKRGNKVYVSYDVASYTQATGENPDWQGKITVFEVNSASTTIHQEGKHLPALSVEPNPIPLGTTTAIIRFSLPQRTRVRLVVYDVLGREAARLLDENRGAGIHSVTFDVCAHPQAAYFVCLQTPMFIEAKALGVAR